MVASAYSARDLTAQLADLLGAGYLPDSGQVTDYAIGPFVPAVAVRPTSIDQVSKILAWAHRNDFSVYPSGGRTLTHLGNNPTRPGIALDMLGLNRMLDFQPADLTVRAQAGMTVAQLDATLAQDGKYVPLAPPMANRATIGGTLATGISGPLRSTYGLPRDWLIGMTVVGPDGTISKSGGQVVKNVTGYDLNRLYTGSLGTLAVIVEATFKITPTPTAWAAVVAAFENNQAAITACRDLLAQPYTPHALHLLNPAAASRLEAEQIPTGYGPVAVAVIAGRPASTRRRVEDIALAWLGAASALRIEDDQAARLTESMADFPVDPERPPSLSIRLNTQPGALEQLMTMESHEIAGVGPGIIADAGFGGGRVMWWNDVSQDEPSHIAESLSKLQAAAVGLGGNAIIETCPPDAKALIDVWGPEPPAMEIMRRIKRQFDPMGVLNPGRFIGGL